MSIGLDNEDSVTLPSDLAEEGAPQNVIRYQTNLLILTVLFFQAFCKVFLLSELFGLDLLYGF